MLSLVDALVELSRLRPLTPFVLCQHHFPFAHVLLVVIMITLPFVWLNTVTVIHLSVAVHPMRDTPILHQVLIWDRYLGPCQQHFAHWHSQLWYAFPSGEGRCTFLLITRTIPLRLRADQRRWPQPY